MCGKDDSKDGLNYQDYKCNINNLKWKKKNSYWYKKGLKVSSNGKSNV